jgi:carboxypeptidase C (cathepsin A)
MWKRPAPLFAALLLAASALFAQPPADAPAKPADAKSDKDAKERKAPEERSSQTHHTITLGGEAIHYTATAGTLVLKDDDGNAKASVFYIAYTRDGVKDPAGRPVTFSFNGGPGAASLWVHMGAFGPRVVERDDEGRGLPPPGRLVDNEFSPLDVTDLVFIDPVSTGFSRPAPGQDPTQFHGVREDIEWVGEFIRLWVTRNERWASPKFVAGESYGTTRAAGLSLYLLDRYGMALNGVVLISSVLNWEDQDTRVGNDIGYLIHLPSYAAAAWYHKKLPPDLQQKDLPAVLSEVEAFATHDYALALMQGDRLAPDKRQEIAARLARYSGLSQDYVERSNLRIDIYRFLKELLRDQRLTIGRLDSRFTGSDLDAAGEFQEFDPSSASLDAPYAAAVNDYIRRDLGFKEDAIYERLTGKVWPWSFGKNLLGYPNLAEDLRQAMTRNPDLKVFFACGYYDFATPFFDAIYTVDHLGLPESLRGNVRMDFFQAGHMMYVRKEEHRKLHQDLADFIRQSAGR